MSTEAPHLRWGLLGTARINDTLIASVPEARERWVAVASRDQDRADQYAVERAIPLAHGSYEALLADPEVDAVYVGLPNALHGPWTQKALEAGKHVLVEKAWSTDPAEVQRAYDTAEAHGLVVAEALMWRHHPQVELALRLLREGAIGQLRSLRAQFSFVLDRPGDVRFDAALGGSALGDVGCYCVSGLRTLAQAEPDEVQAQAVWRDGVDVAMTGLLRFPGDVLGGFDCSFRSASGFALEAIGAEGRLRLDDPWHAFAPAVLVTRTDGEPRVHAAPSPLDGYALELADLEAAVAGQRAPLLGREQAVGQARTLQRLLAAARQALR